MTRTLDIAPLRSFVAVADCAGFLRAARSLHLSQAAVSQHVRRLEAAVGRPLVVRRGRSSQFTEAGEQLLARARQILALHDESLLSFGVEAETTVVIGSTEHAAAQLLPALATTLEVGLPGYLIRFRIDRGTALRDGLAGGRIDVALLLGSTDNPNAVPVGELDLTWYSSPAWELPEPGRPIPLVAFDEPCALRTRALETLTAAGYSPRLSAEAPQLAGVHAVVAAGLGVALMATLGQTPEGLVARDDLPRPRPLPLAVWSRHGLAHDVTLATAGAVHDLLTETTPAQPTNTVELPATIALRQGA